MQQCKQTRKVWLKVDPLNLLVNNINMQIFTPVSLFQAFYFSRNKANDPMAQPLLVYACWSVPFYGECSALLSHRKCVPSLKVTMSDRYLTGLFDCSTWLGSLYFFCSCLVKRDQSATTLTFAQSMTLILDFKLLDLMSIWGYVKELPVAFRKDQKSESGLFRSGCRMH